MAIWKFVVTFVLAGTVAGFFLSTSLLVLLATIFAVVFFVLLVDFIKPSHGTSGHIGLGLIMAAILVFLVPMAITATVVRVAGLHSMVNAPSDTPEGWFQSHFLR